MNNSNLNLLQLPDELGARTRAQVTLRSEACSLKLVNLFVMMSDSVR